MTVFHASNSNSVLRVNPNESEALRVPAEIAHIHGDHDHGSDEEGSDGDDNDDNDADGDGTDGNGSDHEPNEEAVAQNIAENASALGEHFRVHFGQVSTEHQHNGDLSQRQRHYMNHVVDVLQRMMSQSGSAGNNFETQITTVHSVE